MTELRNKVLHLYDRSGRDLRRGWRADKVLFRAKLQSTVSRNVIIIGSVSQ